MDASQPQEKTRPRDESRSERSTSLLDASSQFPMDIWTLCFLDKDVELAHGAQCKSSVLVQGINAIINVILVIVYSTGLSAGCKGIPKQFAPIMAMCFSFQAVELCLFMRLTASIHQQLRNHAEIFKIALAGLLLGCISLFESFSVEAMFDYEPDSSFCTNFGLLSDCTVVLLVILIPYLTHAFAPIKWVMSTVIFTIHALAPFWHSVNIELPAIGINILVGNALGYALEHTLRSVFREQYARRADQDLEMRKKVGENLRFMRAIKGKCGIASGLASGIIARLGRVQHERVAHAVKLMRRMRNVLDEAEWWCEQRQLFVKLELGTYASRRTVCNVDACLTKLAGHKCNIQECQAESCALDEAVLRLALDEALGSAKKFGKLEAEVNISTQIEEHDGSCMLLVLIDSVNFADMLVSSTEQARDANQSSSGVSAFSDGVGLEGLERAAKAIGGRAWLQGYTTPSQVERTVLHFLMPVDRVVWRKGRTNAGAAARVRTRCEVSSTASVSASASASAPAPAPASAPASASASASAFAGSMPAAATGAMRTQSDHDGQQDSLSDQSAASFHDSPSGQELARVPPLSMRARPLVCLGLDDSDICRVFHDFLFESFLNADPARSASLGATVEEIERFADVALGLIGPDLQKVPEDRQRAADVVLIDQHMDIGPKKWLGSDIAQKLRSRQFKGIICVMSGIAGEDLEAMRTAGIVDLALAKGEPPLDIATKILTYAQSDRTNFAQST